MSYQFKHYEKGSTQGSGSYVFRRYSEPSEIVPTSAQYFTFNGSSVTGYNGSLTNIVVPRSYSINTITSQETFTSLSDLQTYCTTNGYNFSFTYEGQDYNITSQSDFNTNSTLIEDIITANGSITVTATRVEYIDGNDYQVDTLGAYCFDNKPALISVTMLDNITSIGGGAFYGCMGLTSITIPSSVTSIGGGAFYGCMGLTSITIPSSVTSIGTNPFQDCTSLQTIIVDSGNTTYDSRNGCNAIIETATNILISGCKNTVITSDITTIGVSAFYGCTSLTSITIPSSVTTIGANAFHGSALYSIYIPSSVLRIEMNAFRMCYNMQAVYIDTPNSTYKCNYLATSWFLGCSSSLILYVKSGMSATLARSRYGSYWNYCSNGLTLTVRATL